MSERNRLRVGSAELPPQTLADMALPFEATAPLYTALLALRQAPASQEVYRSLDMRRHVASFLGRPAFHGKLALSPREFSGDPGTCVCGRVVIMRGPVEVRSRTVTTTALEVHLLGGDTAGDVLFLDAADFPWGPVADEVRRTMELGKVYWISGGVVYNYRALHSTSRLSYHLRVKPPLGVNTIIQECTVSPWTDVPLHHPFVEIGRLGRVATRSRSDADITQVCVVGVVSEQPGVVEVFARPGSLDTVWVCNAVITQGRNHIRCAFWRDHAARLAAFPVGATVALMQVVALEDHDGCVELCAVPGTQVTACPGLLAETILEELLSLLSAIS